jgi:hypothetical protein
LHPNELQDLVKMIVQMGGHFALTGLQLLKIRQNKGNFSKNRLATRRHR